MAAKKKAAALEVEVKETAKKPAKKVVIKDDTPVRVFNNTTGGISFKNSKGLWKRMAHRGFADVTYADLEHLYIESPRILTSGSLYIAWQPVREKLGLDYDHIFALKDIEQVLELPEHLLLDKIYNAPRALQVEVVQHMIDNIDNYRLSVVRVVEQATKISIFDTVQY